MIYLFCFKILTKEILHRQGQENELKMKINWKVKKTQDWVTLQILVELKVKSVKKDVVKPENINATGEEYGKRFFMNSG